MFVDGVRVNEADASQVHLSLIPGGAVDRIELIRGSVGAFGRNSLAGALNIVTRRGTEPSVELEMEGGSFGLLRGALGASGSAGSFDGFAVASYDRSSGWRQLERHGGAQLLRQGRLAWRRDRRVALLYVSVPLPGGSGPSARFLAGRRWVASRHHRSACGSPATPVHRRLRRCLHSPPSLPERAGRAPAR